MFIGAALQSAVGFGFALVAAPLLFVSLGPEEAVWSLNALALGVNGALLLSESRRPEPMGRLTITVLAWSVPGMVVGALILRAADPRLLQAALTVTVLAALGLRLAVRGRAAAPAPGWASPVTGAATGVLTTSLSTAGPPLVLLLLGRGHAPARVRDTLATIFIAQSVLGVTVLAATSGGDIPLGPGLFVLLAAALLGQVAGRPLFARLAVGSYEPVLTAVLVAAVTIGMIAAVT